MVARIVLLGVREGFRSFISSYHIAGHHVSLGRVPTFAVPNPPSHPSSLILPSLSLALPFNVIMPDTEYCNTPSFALEADPRPLSVLGLRS